VTKQVEIKAGDRYGRLVILEEIPPHVYPSGENRRKFLMQCDCGSPPKSFLLSSFRNGTTLSCGCYNLEKGTSHGMHKTRQYQCWADMKTRCNNVKHKWYPSYGGRGITVCDKWNTFEGFWEDMQEGYSDNLTLNRRDNDKGYYKENCAWDTANFQGHMQRKLEGTAFSEVGVSVNNAGKFSASIKLNSERLHLGSYETVEEAAEAYDEASYRIYGDRPNKTLETRAALKEKVTYYFDNIAVDIRPKGSSHSGAKLLEKDVLEMRDLYSSGLFTQGEIAILYNVALGHISGILRRACWKHI